MKDYITISSVYFIGIGGIGMSALARYYLSKNVTVRGYDKTPTPLSKQMESEGIVIHYEDKVELLDKNAELVVYTPAIPKEHKEFNYYKEHNYEIAKRSDVLQQITKSTFNICIAGTHGKTTISTMVAYILRHSGFGCNAFLGGISVNYDTNFWSSDNNVSVVEADEYDRSFLKLTPDIALISAMDADHLDIYGTLENMQDTFLEFANRLKPGGLLLTKYGLTRNEFHSSNHIRYSLQNNAADAYASNITMRNGGYEFGVTAETWMLDKVKLNMGGMHNVENAVAAITIANYLKIDPVKIKASVEAFKGVKRRFEYIISPSEAEQEKNNVVFIDDYAHHPEELKALITSAKSLFNNRKCTVIFQPHLFSRTNDFAKQFAESLDNADEILLLPIYPARESPIEGVTNKLILEKMKNEHACVINAEKLLKYLSEDYIASVKESMNGQLLITAGAGNIDQLIQPIKKILLNTI
ncbi:MAG: UDP-N-acetylmuramate--L-alanine ligase [Bacteroidota bacterium]|nr:UDP-N-acetylmuramate--L-alanine ligase [Bacteroidota bacterium]